ncbi:MAG TPA: alternative ribosome rescue aminoacyl-tRNA hydrolase ArfB [Acidimicrobiia bacterium]|nr:alternative ribosome rescue aminoacyl-tRNA hydrolase ArfB [Acidimicrobiia bacterium]
MDEFEVAGHIIPAAELEETFDTSGGPGGQHANRNETAVRLRFHVETSSLPAEVKKRLVDRIGPRIEVVSAQSRSQFRNRAMARQQLKEKIEEALREKRPRRSTKPTKASKKKRVEKKRTRGETKRLRQTPPQED